MMKRRSPDEPVTSLNWALSIQKNGLLSSDSANKGPVHH